MNGGEGEKVFFIHLQRRGRGERERERCPFLVVVPLIYYPRYKNPDGDTDCEGDGKLARDTGKVGGGRTKESLEGRERSPFWTRRERNKTTGSGESGREKGTALSRKVSPQIGGWDYICTGTGRSQSIDPPNTADVASRMTAEGL